MNMPEDQEQAAAKPAGFVGWHRLGRRSRWRPLLSSQTLAETMDALSEVVGGDRYAGPVGIDPNIKQPARKRKGASGG